MNIVIEFDTPIGFGGHKRAFNYCPESPVSGDLWINFDQETLMYWSTELGWMEMNYNGMISGIVKHKYRNKLNVILALQGLGT